MQIYEGVCYFDASLFNKSGPKPLATHHIVRLSKCAFRDISFDMIICTSTEILHAHFQLIKLFAVSHVAGFPHMSHFRVPVPELGISSSKLYRKFKSPLI